MAKELGGWRTPNEVFFGLEIAA